MKSARVVVSPTLPLMPRSWPFESSTPKYESPYVYRPLWGCDKPRPFPRVVQRGKMKLSDIPGAFLHDSFRSGPSDARIIPAYNPSKGDKPVFFWISRSKHHKGQVAISQNAPWEGPRDKIRYVDSVEAAVALAKILDWMPHSGPAPETKK